MVRDIQPSLEREVAIHGEQIRDLTRRLDLWARVALAVLIAFVGAGASFLFVIIGQLTG